MNNNTDVIIEKMIIDLKEHNEERDRLIEVSNAMINEYKLKIEKYEQEKKDKEEFILSQVKGLLENAIMKETKTQLSYTLPSGKIIIKKPEKIIKLNKDYDIKDIPSEFIETKENVKWGELKKKLIIMGEDVINLDNGEVVECCSIEEKPEEIKIKL